MLLNFGVGEDSWESLGLKGDQTRSILKEISPEYSLEGWMLKLKLQYSSHLMQSTDLLGKILMLEKIEGRRRQGWQRWDGWMASLTQWTWVWVGSRSWWWTGKPGMLQSMGLQRVGHDWATELNWTELNWTELKEITPFQKSSASLLKSVDRLTTTLLISRKTILYSNVSGKNDWEDLKPQPLNKKCLT